MMSYNSDSRPINGIEKKRLITYVEHIFQQSSRIQITKDDVVIYALSQNPFTLHQSTSEKYCDVSFLTLSKSLIWHIYQIPDTHFLSKIRYQFRDEKLYWHLPGRQRPLFWLCTRWEYSFFLCCRATFYFTAYRNIEQNT